MSALTPLVAEAITTCSRVLSGSPEDLAIGEPDVLTIGPWRAAGDRAALRRRYHRADVHERHRPEEPVAAAAYDLLAIARIDALGMQWLTGVAANLLAYPGTDDQPIRWLAFESFTARPAPAIRSVAVARARGVLPAASLTSLRDLHLCLDSSERFSAGAAAWALAAAQHLARLPPAETAAPLPWSPRPGASDVRRGRYARPGAKRREDEGEACRDDLGESKPGEQWSGAVLGASGYRAYTTAYDRVVDAAALASRAELAALRRTLDAELAGTRATVARLAKRLLRVLQARQVREWRFDQDDGLLDAARLAPFVAGRGAVRPFKQELDSRFPSTCITLLIDHSGSMRGRPMQIAAMTVEIFARVLERCGVTCEVLGFTTRDWDGGEPARQWAAAGYPDRPGRLNALEHIVIKAASVPWRRARPSLGLFLRDEMLKENIDGEAVAWAHQRLLARPERRRILVVVSDGTPMEEATFAANGWDYLDDHLLRVVDGIQSRSPVALAAIGIGHDVTRFYRNATRISKVDDLGPALTDKLIGLLGEESTRR